MPSPFHGIDTASRALRSFQRALDVTGHNISNVNTNGYSRQAIDLSPTEPTSFYGLHPMSLGTGVAISSVNRIRNLFLDARRMGVQSDLGRSASLESSLRQVEGLFLEPGGKGISDALNSFFNAWSGLASNPNEPGMRVQVQLAGQTLTKRIRSTYLEMETLKAQQVGAVTQTLDEMETLGKQIAELNSQIRQKAVMGATPNDLMDIRDVAIQKLSELADIRTQTFNDGTMTVYLNQLTLVDTAGARPVPRTYDAAAGTLSDGANTYSVRSGSLSGLFGSINRISGYQGQLDSLANNLRSQVNPAHASGINALGTTGINFFNDSTPQSGAIDFDLDLAVLADPNAIAAGVSGAAGDGALALTLSRMRDVPIPGLGGKAFGRFYADLVGEIGRETSYYRDTFDTHRAISEQIENQIQSVSGVSIDDEMANMLRFQRSFQAAAKALSIFDQVTEDLINMLRR